MIQRHDIRDSGVYAAAAFHLILAPWELQPQMGDVQNLRTEHNVAEKPLYIWEPFPDYCTNEHLASHLDVAHCADVFSTNHLELLALFNYDAPGDQLLDESVIERCAAQVLVAAAARNPTLAVVIRAAQQGCLVMTRDSPSQWYPAYHATPSSKVVEVTGAGNMFLGALTYALGDGRDLTEAVMCASVAAGFAIEQIGLPVYTHVDGRDLWNGVEFEVRLAEYRSRL